MISINEATMEHLEQVQRIARSHKNELGFVMRVSLERAIAKCELTVIEVFGDGVVAFANWHKRRDGWVTVYEIAVDKSYNRMGFGTMLLDCLEKPLRLKCTTDNTVANMFYEGYGFTLARVENGRKRQLNVWECARTVEKIGEAYE